MIQEKDVLIIGGGISGIPVAKDPDEEGIWICVEQIKELKEIKGIHGVHLMGMDVEEKPAQIVDRSGLSPRPKVE